MIVKFFVGVLVFFGLDSSLICLVAFWRWHIALGFAGFIAALCSFALAAAIRWVYG